MIAHIDSFDFQYYQAYKKVYSINKMYLNYDHISPTQGSQIVSSTFSTEQRIVL